MQYIFIYLFLLAENSAGNTQKKVYIATTSTTTTATTAMVTAIALRSFDQKVKHHCKPQL